MNVPAYTCGLLVDVEQHLPEFVIGRAGLADLQIGADRLRRMHLELHRILVALLKQQVLLAQVRVPTVRTLVGDLQAKLTFLDERAARARARERRGPRQRARPLAEVVVVDQVVPDQRRRRFFRRGADHTTWRERRRGRATGSQQRQHQRQRKAMAGKRRRATKARRSEILLHGGHPCATIASRAQQGRCRRNEKNTGDRAHARMAATRFRLGAGRGVCYSCGAVIRRRSPPRCFAA